MGTVELVQSLTARHIQKLRLCDNSSQNEALLPHTAIPNRVIQ